MIQVDQAHKTRAWCRKNEFTGIRADPILNNVEIWVLGVVAEEVTEAAILLNPNAIAEAYARAFSLNPEDVQLE